MEEELYLNDSQRAIIAARMASRPRVAHKIHLHDASIEAPVSQAEAARRLRVGRSSVQRAANLLKNAAPELVAAVEAGRVHRLARARENGEGGRGLAHEAAWREAPREPVPCPGE